MDALTDLETGRLRQHYQQRQPEQGLALDPLLFNLGPESSARPLHHLHGLQPTIGAHVDESSGVS